jgi:hypothetical protein
MLFNWVRFCSLQLHIMMGCNVSCMRVHALEPRCSKQLWQLAQLQRRL